jgi:hypothetical protein
METTGQSSLFELSLDQESIDHLTETAKWGKFLAVIGFVFCGLIVISAFVFGAIFASSAFSKVPGYSNEAGFFGLLGGSMFAGVYIIAAAIYFFPCLFLYNFSVRLRSALRTNDQVKLNQALKNQKMLYRFVGIMTIIVVSMYAVVLVFVALALALIPRAIS